MKLNSWKIQAALKLSWKRVAYAYHWSTYKCNDRLDSRLADLISCHLLVYTSTLSVHCLGNFLSVRPMDQHERQLEVIFYFRRCILWPGVGLLARQIRLAMTVVVKSWITHYSLDPIVLTSNSSCMDRVFLFEKYFSFLSELV